MNQVRMKFEGMADWAAKYLEARQLNDPAQWRKFVDVYRDQPDHTNSGWRGEFWGKMMRGGSLVYAYTRNEEVYQVLTGTVEDMITTAEHDGRVSSYARSGEFDAWDLWCRKYVLLGMEYYLDICKDAVLKERIIVFLKGALDYIMSKIGKGPDKKEITDATRSWYGINSTSILEPVVRLYRLTGEKKYLDFATYIIETGGADGINIFELAYENKIKPYQYGVSKAYEMTSCFEGLLEYYYETGIEKYRTAVINYAHAVLDTEISVIGSCGVTHELFDHTRTRQTIKQDEVAQEICVTVTWMKFCSRLFQLTGESLFIDCMEQSFFNSYLGAFNVDKKHSRSSKFRHEKEGAQLTLMPLDSYSPLIPGYRGLRTGGYQILGDMSYYGCCACICAAGVGVYAQEAVCIRDGAVYVNFFEKGSAEFEYDGAKVTLRMDTDYPVSGLVNMHIIADRPVTFTLKVRVPAWTGRAEGYTDYSRTWQDDMITVDYPMEIRAQYPETWEEDLVYTGPFKHPKYQHGAGPLQVTHKPEDDDYVCLMRGPITLAADSRMGKAADSVFDFEPVGEVCEDRRIVPGTDCLVKVAFKDKQGNPFYLVDYASAGRDWETCIAAWLPVPPKAQ
ncbi:MAG: hypothetical protein E7329_08120 [Clostridiales bacterium]|nr:hypothetical protein [Clostridiales bacterium]